VSYLGARKGVPIPKELLGAARRELLLGAPMELPYSSSTRNSRRAPL